MNLGQDGRQTVLDGLVGEVQHPVARPSQKHFSLGVMLALGGVHSSIKFDGEATIWTAEIHHKRTNGMLAAKLQTSEAAIA
jgi:hypothetical protein